MGGSHGCFVTNKNSRVLSRRQRDAAGPAGGDASVPSRNRGYADGITRDVRSSYVDFARMGDILYVYAIARAAHPLPERVEAIDGSDVIDFVTAGELSAFVTPVDDV